jgi:hypothetical protein
MNMRGRRCRLIDKRNKRIYRLYHRYRAIDKELRKKYQMNLNGYLSFNKSVDEIDEFLKLRDEGERISDTIYNKEYKRCVKYVKGGGTYFYTPMMKKERRKALRKFRLNPLGYYLKIYEDDQDFFSE